MTDSEKKQLVPWLAVFYGEKQPYIPLLGKAIIAGKEPEEAWKIAFPNQKFDSQKYHRRCYNLADAVDHYITSLELINSPETFNRLLLQAYSSRGSFELMERAQERMYKELTGYKARRKSLSIEKLRLAHDVAGARQVVLATKGVTEAAKGIKDMNDTFDTWWLHEKLYHTILTLYSNFQGENRPELPFLAFEALAEAQRRLPENPHETPDDLLGLGFLYHYITGFLQKPRDLTGDRELIPLLFQWLEQLGFVNKPLPSTIINFFYLLIGICVNRSNQSSDISMRYFYYQQIWNLHMFGIQKKILLENGNLSWDRFIQLVTISYRMELFEAELGEKPRIYKENLEELSRLLPYDERTDALRLGEALGYFQKGDYSRSLRLLRYKFKRPMYEALSRTYQCQCMYEEKWRLPNQDFEPLRHDANALRRYVERAPGLTDSFRQRVKNFCLFYDKLCKDYRRDRLPKLGQRIKKTSMLAHREWLVRKLSDKLKAKQS